jgi:hypothetical protein
MMEPSFMGSSVDDGREFGRTKASNGATTEGTMWSADVGEMHKFATCDRVEGW